jgi:hypothetical protein
MLPIAELKGWYVSTWPSQNDDDYWNELWTTSSGKRVRLTTERKADKRREGKLGPEFFPVSHPLNTLLPRYIYLHTF